MIEPVSAYNTLSQGSAMGDIQRYIAIKIMKDSSQQQMEMINKLIIEPSKAFKQKRLKNSPYTFDTYA